MRKATLKRILIALSLVMLLGTILACGDSDEDSEDLGEQISSRSYKGHEDDMDANNLVNIYPSIVGTRLDERYACPRVIACS